MARRFRYGRLVALLLPAFGVVACSTIQRSGTGQGKPIAIHVLVTGARAHAGPVRCAIYRDPSLFMTREGVWQGASAGARGGTAEFNFIVPSGIPIAVSVFQDLDEDSAFDRGPLGVPAEPWGTSGTFSVLLPPSWRSSSIVPEFDETEIVIALVGGPRGQSER